MKYNTGSDSNIIPYFLTKTLFSRALKEQLGATKIA